MNSRRPDLHLRHQCLTKRPRCTWRRRALCIAACVSGAPQADAAAAGTPKVLRYAFQVAETGFDPAQITDLYSTHLVANIFDAPLDLRLPRAAGEAASRTRPRRCPRSRPTSRTFTLRIRPGIYFADDPAFKRQRRELDRRGLRLLA